MVIPRLAVARAVLVLVVAAVGACGRPSPAPRPPLETPAATAVELLAEQLRLPRLPASSLKLDEALETEEESETVIDTGEGQRVLPTTTVHRFTLRGIDPSSTGSIAEVALVTVSIAQLEDDASGGHIEIRSEGRLLFDVEHGAPVSLELSRTETFAVGEAEGERSLSLRALFRRP